MHNSKKCGAAVLAWSPPLDDEELLELDHSDRVASKKLRGLGRSEIWAEFPAYRVPGPIAWPRFDANFVMAA